MFNIKKIKKNIQELENLDPEKWDQICKNCGLCCLTKIEDEDKIYYSNFACQHFDIKTKKCNCYCNRLDNPGCQKLTLGHILAGKTVPDSCAYVEKIFGRAKYPAKINWTETQNINSLDFDDYEKIMTETIPASVFWSARYNFGDNIFPEYSDIKSTFLEYITE